jgi:hypothetical protein
VDYRNTIPTTGDAPAEGASRRTVLFYSPDIDFCVSMRLLFQDRYHVVTVSDPEMVVVAAREFQPYLMVVDSPPTKSMTGRFEQIKREFPKTQIISFYAPQFNRATESRSTFPWVDAAFTKPIDLAEVTKHMSEMMSESS